MENRTLKEQSARSCSVGLREVRAMARKLVDLSREISHMMPVANPHINQVPAFWDRLTHESTKGRWKSDISFHIRDFLIGEHVGTHVDALCHYDPRPGAPCLDKLPLEMFLTEAVCVDVSHVRPAAFITADDLEERARQRPTCPSSSGDTFLYWQDYYARKDEPNWLHEFAGLDWEAAQWLADQGVVNIGCECASIDSSAAMPFDARARLPRPSHMPGPRHPQHGEPRQSR